MTTPTEDVVQRLPGAFRRMQERDDVVTVDGDGGPAVVLVPPEQWEALCARDFKAELLARLAEDDPGIPHEEAMRELGVKWGPLDV